MLISDLNLKRRVLMAKCIGLTKLRVKKPTPVVFCGHILHYVTHLPDFVVELALDVVKSMIAKRSLIGTNLAIHLSRRNWGTNC
jgi:hypothetical protein